jgi:5'(3')-deoxyribonucleotidase
MPGSSVLNSINKHSEVSLQLVSYCSTAVDFQECQAIKLAWLADYFPEISPNQVTFAGVERALLDADVLIDDSPKNVKAFLEGSFTRKAFVIEQPYNRKFFAPRSFNAADLKDAFELISYRYSLKDR